MRTAKIQLKGQFAIDRDRAEPLSLQIARQLQEAIDAGRLAPGACLPSTRPLARILSVSRNTVLAAYEELVARGVVRSRRGAGMYVFAPTTVSGFRPYVGRGWVGGMLKSFERQLERSSA